MSRFIFNIGAILAFIIYIVIFMGLYYLVGFEITIIVLLCNYFAWRQNS